MVVSVNMGEDASTVQAYADKHRLTFAHLLDTDKQLAGMLGVPATPATFVVNHKMQLLGGALGYRDWNSPEMHRLVKKLLEGSRNRTSEVR